MIEWHVDETRFAWGSVCRLGRWTVARTAHGAINRPQPWGAYCYLPGVSNVGQFASEELAKAAVESAVRNWLSGCGLVAADVLRAEVDAAVKS